MTGLIATLHADAAAFGKDRKNMIMLILRMFAHRSLSVNLWYRLSSACEQKPGKFWKCLAKFFWRLNILLNVCDIDRQCVIGPGLVLPHPQGIVIGAGARIGNNAVILHNVTIGARHPHSPKNDRLYPALGNNIRIGAGAVIVGGITIGDLVEIPANAVVGATLEVKLTHSYRSDR